MGLRHRLAEVTLVKKSTLGYLQTKVELSLRGSLREVVFSLILRQRKDITTEKLLNRFHIIDV